MKSKYIYRSLIISLTCALLMSEVSAGLFNRLLYMMMRNRRRHYVPFPVSLSPFSNFGSSSLGGMYPLSLSSLSNSITPSAISAASAAIPYSQYLSSLAGLSGIPPISPLGPWGGINPYYSYLNLADYPDYRSFPTIPNYLPLPSYTPPIYTPPSFPSFPAVNISDIKENDKKISARAAAAAAASTGSTGSPATGLAYNIQGQDRKELLSKLKYLANHRQASNYRAPLLFPETDDLMDSFR